MSNSEIAGLLDNIAGLLEIQGANPFRIQAYRKASQNIRQLKEPATELLEEGTEHLQEAVPGVGRSLARVIEEYVRTGRSGQLERLRGELSPEDLYQQVPGIGEEMARRIVSELDIDTLEDLEVAAHDGRLKKVEGFGERRVAGIRNSLAGILSRSAGRRTARIAEKSEQKQGMETRPPAGLVLDVDREYRKRADAGDLKKIAPRRFNPEGKAWLPILHTERSDWSFTALFSNTARAHDLGKTGDWVVIYYDGDGDEGQYTVVTQQTGPLKGKRVIRGREQDCSRYYGS